MTLLMNFVFQLTEAEDTSEQLKVCDPDCRDVNSPIGVVVPAVRACIRNPLKLTSPCSVTVQKYNFTIIMSMVNCLLM